MNKVIKTRNYNSDRKSGGRPFNRGQSDRPEMHDAICDNCRKNCKVPFKPTGGKPIYCSNCFEKVGGGNNDRDRRGSRDSGYSRDARDFQNKEMFSAVCIDCGKECEVPFRPTGDKPIYCSRCFEKRGNTRESDANGVSMSIVKGLVPNPNAARDKVLEEISTKLDKIITLLEPKKVVKKAKKITVKEL
ncbi:MAG: hypothetical protein UT34_C0002G0305 [candidate division WS6 bacterium GW2011_GWF2_39_15]|uniref:CxxC-x17-CxxC domain-containing protein n=1 Tax=candidate division WS6 bacterium GW2011_GWF2_39_15 TaxID=1619100 RepID=A0A0G0MRK6_9BACT|nr:MAG: hypothetical protein UT34_C0002G0305 [candidate division WS6 bacterium GW2011_GWF2_39_15]